MKNLKLLYLVAIVCLAFVSCSKDDDTAPEEQAGKKIKAISIVNGDDKDSVTYTYNSSGLLTETKWYGNYSTPTLQPEYSTEYAYSNGKLIQTISYKWNTNGKYAEDKDSIEYVNTSTIKIYYLDYVDSKFVESGYITTAKLNSSNLPVKLDYEDGDSSVLIYSANNIVTEKYYSSGALYRTTNYTFDSKNNPFKGNFNYFLDLEYYNANNITKLVNSTGTEANYTYEYDNDNYPTKYSYVSSSKPNETKITKIYYE